MADLRLYPNLPGVVSNISVETQVPTFDDSLPKALIFATHSEDQFQDGTPILFNEPYFIVSDAMLTSMFQTSSKLGTFAAVIGNTSSWEVIPVVVRIGKKDIQAGGGTDVESITMSAVSQDGTVTATDFEVSWEGDPTWRSNFVLKVEYTQAADTATIYVNDVAVEENATLPVSIPSLGLTIDKAGTPTEDTTEYFKFQYAVEPSTNDEVYDALQEAMDQVTGLEVDIIYSPDVYYGETYTADKNPIQALASFASTQSTQFKSVLAYVGAVMPKNYTFSGIKAWVDTLANTTCFSDTERTTLGKYTVVVAGHGYIPTVSDSQVLDLAPYVATKLLSEQVYTGPINLEMPEIQLVENISLDQANTLSSKAITALYNKPGVNKIATILVGRTMAPTTSQFTKISSVLVINEYMNGLRAIADRFLGQPNSGTVRMSMQSTMQNYTNNFVSTGRIAGGTVTVEPDVTSGAINALNVKATIKAFAEIEVITLSVKFEYQIG